MEVGRSNISESDISGPAQLIVIELKRKICMHISIAIQFKMITVIYRFSGLSCNAAVSKMLKDYHGKDDEAKAEYL
uniref:Uncharacterized protein n=1 Tax=Onchocerca volvulus TaxID=6282 RepID=A0A8R1TRT6_ONCVO